MGTRRFIKALARRLVFGLPVAILVGIIFFIWIERSVDRGTPVTRTGPTATVEPDAAPEEKADLPSTDIPPDVNRSESGISLVSDGGRSRRAYRFLMDEGKVRLEAVTDLEGDFRIARGGSAWLPGMLCCRLLDGEGQVLAQETLAAPDLSCVSPTGRLSPVSTVPEPEPRWSGPGKAPSLKSTGYPSNSPTTTA